MRERPTRRAAESKAVMPPLLALAACATLAACVAAKSPWLVPQGRMADLAEAAASPADGGALPTPGAIKCVESARRAVHLFGDLIAAEEAVRQSKKTGAPAAAALTERASKALDAALQGERDALRDCAATAPPALPDAAGLGVSP